MAEENRNQELLDDFERWNKKVFTRYVRSFDRAKDDFEKIDALGQVDQALRATATDFEKDHEKFVDQVLKLETQLKDDVKQPKLVAANKSEFEDLKEQQGDLRDRLTAIRTQIAQASTPSEGKEEEPTTPAQKADGVINKYSLIAAGLGVVPIPVLDLAGIATVQGIMLSELSVIYYPGDPRAGFSKHFAQNLLTIVLSTFGSAALFGAGVASALKFVPLIGSLPGAGAVSLIGGTATFVVGKIVKEELEKGLTPAQIMETLKTVDKSKVAGLRKAAASLLKT
jgi:uncharacterized protein (DUF697 family)